MPDRAVRSSKRGPGGAAAERAWRDGEHVSGQEGGPHGCSCAALQFSIARISVSADRFRRGRSRYGPAGCERGIRSKAERARVPVRLRPGCFRDTARAPIRSGLQGRTVQAKGPVAARAGFRRRGSAGTGTHRKPDRAARLRQRDPLLCGEIFPRHRTVLGHPGLSRGFRRRGSAAPLSAGLARRPRWRARNDSPHRKRGRRSTRHRDHAGPGAARFRKSAGRGSHCSSAEQTRPASMYPFA